MIPIVAATQKYHWGKLGTSSFAGKYSRKTYPNTDEELFQHIHFAEIWMGTHPKAPSSAVISENIQQWLTPAFYEANKGKTVSLTSVIDANRETFLSKSDIFLTEDITTGHLPYLFKVLWLETPLSIQAHPDKTLAEKLHADFSNLYLDDNHKPEMVVALTEFEALWSFSDGASIHRRISSVPSVAKFFDSVNIDDLLDESKFKDTLRFLLKTAYDTPEEVLIECISGMVSEIEAINPEDRARHQRLALQLQKHYSCDVGVIVSFFLNYFELKCGECIVVDVNEPHAWLKGECIELVAASDNVVRGGLTPKYKDIGTFLDMLGYETKSYIPYMGERNDLGFATHVVYNFK